MWFFGRLFPIGECADCGVLLKDGEGKCWMCTNYPQKMKDTCAGCNARINDQNHYRWQEKGNWCDMCDAEMALLGMAHC